VVVGDADDPQVAVSLSRRLDDVLSGNQAIELANIMVTELMAQGGIDDHQRLVAALCE
jgi:hypothetical protein